MTSLVQSTGCRRNLALFSAYAILAGCSAARLSGGTPDWLTAVATQPASFNYGQAKAAILLKEDFIDVSRSGVLTIRHREAVRILNKDGRAYAVARQDYNTSANRVKSFRAWLIQPSGKTLSMGKDDVRDWAIYSNARELYGEARQMIISAEDEASVGAVFAYESVVKEESISSQWTLFLQGRLPIERSVLTIKLAKSWDATVRTFNHNPVPSVDKELGRTWELRQMPAVDEEPACPPIQASCAWLAVDFTPPSQATTLLQPLTSWSAISAYLTPKYNSASAPDASITAKAAELVASAGSTWNRIRRLCEYVQRSNSISINMNFSRGGGVIPRQAAKVLQCYYGDCKDKVTLLRALLNTQGIESFPLAVSLRGGRYIQSDWPSVDQFDHCILVIRVEDAVAAPAFLTHPTYGRLVLFDPSDPHTPLGWLPKEDCGGHGLVLAGTAGGLIALPETRPDENRMARKITAQLAGNGSISGSIEEIRHGNCASDARAELQRLSASDYHKHKERQLSLSLPLAQINRIAPRDEFEADKFSLTTEFTSPNGGKPMRDVLLMVKPVVVTAWSSSPPLKAEKRTQPVIIDPSSFTEESIIILPRGYLVEELPSPVELKTSFGTYKSALHIEAGNRIVQERSLVQSATVIPAAEYKTIRDFYEKIAQAEQSPVVLRKIRRQ